MNILILILLNLTLDSQQLQKVSIENNRAYFYFNLIPEYQTSLNDEKNKVNLEFINSKLNSGINNLVSSGVIKEVTNVSDGNKIVSQVVASSNGKGYTAITLPFSKTIIVDLFEWDKLNEFDKKFRLALLSLESGLTEEAYQNLEIASSNGNFEAKAIYGILLMNEGKINTAKDYIFEANRDSIKIPDLYAAISIYCSNAGDRQSESKYKDLFKEKSGLYDFPQVNLTEVSSEYNIPDYFYPSAKKEFKSQKDTNKITLSEEKKESFDPLSGMGFYLIIFAFFALLIGLFIFRNYMAWRKKQLEFLAKMKKRRIDEEVKLKREKNQETIEQLQQERTIEEKKVESKIAPPSKNIFTKKYAPEAIKSEPTKKPEINIDLKQKKMAPVVNVKQKNKKEDIEKFLENYIPVKRAIEKDKVKENIKDDEANLFANIISNDSETLKSPEAKLAKKLADEKQKYKQEQISKLAQDRLNSFDNIDEEAKKMGLEVGGLETKHNLDSLSENEDKLSKLSKKFSVDTNNKEEKK